MLKVLGPIHLIGLPYVWQVHQRSFHTFWDEECLLATFGVQFRKKRTPGAFCRDLRTIWNYGQHYIILSAISDAQSMNRASKLLNLVMNRCVLTETYLPSKKSWLAQITKRVWKGKAKQTPFLICLWHYIIVLKWKCLSPPKCSHSWLFLEDFCN